MNEKTAIQNVNVLEQALDLQAPALPVEFAERLFCMDALDFFTGWLLENVPEPVYQLAHAIQFFEMYSREAAKNAGMVPGDLNDAAPDYLREGLQLLAALGYQF